MLFRLLTLVPCSSSLFKPAQNTIDVRISQLFPDQTEYFPPTNDPPAVKSIGDGGKWITVHTNTARLWVIPLSEFVSDRDPSYFRRMSKPEVLTAAAIVTKKHFSSFVPFNCTTPFPDGTPCRKCPLLYSMFIILTGPRWCGGLPTRLCLYILDRKYVNHYFSFSRRLIFVSL